MPTICPKCNKLTVERDPRSGALKCFATDCSWIDRGQTAYSVLEVRTVKASNKFPEEPNLLASP